MRRRSFLAGFAALLASTSALAQPYSRAPGPVNGASPLGYPAAWGPQGTGSDVVTPDAIPGLTFAIRPDQGLTLSGSSITAAAAAWGTSIGVTGVAGTTAPAKAAAFGSNGQDLFKFTSGSTQFFTIGSTLSLPTACTVFWMYAPTVISTTKVLFGNLAATSYIRTVAVGSNRVTVLGLLTVGGVNVNIPLTAGIQPYFNMLPMALTYDSAVAGGTVNVYVNNILAGTAAGVGAGGFNFNRIGVTGAASLCFDGYMGPVLAYNRVMTATERGQLHNFFKPWRGQNLYIAASGDDASLTPWSQTTPLKTLAAAAAYPVIGFETLAAKGGDIFRFTNQATVTTPGLSSSERLSWDGGLWGAGKAQLRSSTAPAVTVVSGTVYDCGAFGSSPSHYVHYIPGGVINFGPNMTLGSMQRLTEDTSTPGTPAIGKWGYTGGHVFVNTGTAVSAGDIEVTLVGSAGILNTAATNWNVNNFIIAFPAATAGVAQASFQTWTGMEAYFGTQDGLDGVSGAIGLYYNNCITAYNGAGPAGTGASAGDGFSHHAGCTATFTNCQAWYNDKGGFNHIGDCNVFHYNCISVGSLCYRVSNGVGGSLTVINCLGIVTADAFSIDCVRNDSSSDLAVIENNTLISLKDPAAGGSGIIQILAGGSITAKNNIIKGFATGLNWQGAGALDADYNDMFANTAGYAGTTAGPHDILTDPQFTDSGDFNYVLLPTSPALRAGQFIRGIAADLAGVTRPNPPSIGAYESTQYPVPLLGLENGLGAIGLENGLGAIAKESPPWP